MHQLTFLREEQVVTRQQQRTEYMHSDLVPSRVWFGLHCSMRSREHAKLTQLPPGGGDR